MDLMNASIDLNKTRERNQRTDGHLDNYIGHRAKIGVIIPSTNTSVEYDCQRVIPRGVTWHFSRFLIEHADLSDDDVDGGEILTLMSGLNWYWSRYGRFMVEYGYSTVGG